MSTIYVRTVPGRIAREAPRGPYIPSDQWVEVQVTPYIMRLLHVHCDIEQYVPEDQVVEQEQPRKKKSTTSTGESET
jgi:hypothetical protein